MDLSKMETLEKANEVPDFDQEEEIFIISNYDYDAVPLNEDEILTMIINVCIFDLANKCFYSKYFLFLLYVKT